MLLGLLGCAADPVGTSESVDFDGDGFSTVDDCDDDDDTVYPGALERCDERQNDCAADWASDQGLASFVSTSGAWVDLSEQLSEGRMGAPVQVGLTEPGELRLCGGVWFLSLQLTEDLDVVGTGRSSTYLSGAGAVSAVVVRYDGVAASLTGLTLEDGVAHTTQTVAGEALAVGGGLLCDGQASVRLDDVAVRGNVAEAGGGVAALGGCELELVDVAFTDNLATVEEGTSRGGALLVAAAAGSAGVTSFTGNEAEGPEGLGGAVALVDGTLALTEGSFMQNEASATGGGLHVSGGELSVSTGSVRYGEALAGGGLYLDGGLVTLHDLVLEDNAAADAGGAIYVRDGRLTVSACDFADNTPDDVRATSSGSHDFGDGASFSCADGVCTE